MRAVVLTAVMLSACPKPPTLTPQESDALSAAKAGWVAAGLRPPGDCLRDARVEWADSDASFAATCQVGADSAAGCMTISAEQRGLIVYPIVVITLSPAQPAATSERVIIHEALHALVGCKLGRSPYDPWDGGHTDPRVWVAAGGATSAQARAEALVR